jgi:hypothetical protein
MGRIEGKAVLREESGGEGLEEEGDRGGQGREVAAQTAADGEQAREEGDDCEQEGDEVEDEHEAGEVEVLVGAVVGISRGCWLPDDGINFKRTR